MSPAERPRQDPSGEVWGLSELVHRGAVATCDRLPRLHRWLGIALAVPAVVCVIAMVSRFSLLPLAPLPFLAFAGYSLSRIPQLLDRRRRLLTWTILFLLSVLAAFWVLAVAGRYFHVD